MIKTKGMIVIKTINEKLEKNDSHFLKLFIQSIKDVNILFLKLISIIFV